MKIIPSRWPYMSWCLVLLIISFPSWVLAGVHAGVEVGVNVSSLSYVDDVGFPFPYWDRGWRTSFTGGATMEVPLRGRWALVTGLRYVQQGNRVKFDLAPLAPGVVGEFRVAQHYLSMPVLLAWRPLPSRRFFFSLGPEIALLLSGRIVTEYSSPEALTMSDNIQDDLESTNLSVDAGAGFEFPVERHVGVVTLRYSHGLAGVAKEEHWVSDWKTRGVESLVGVRW